MDRVPAVPGKLPHSERLALVDTAFRSLPDRYLGADESFDATYHVRLGDLGHTWEVRCTRHGARVRKGATRRQPDVTLTTDSDTWMRLREGEFSGVEAFQRRLLAVRGNLDHAVAFEGMFRLPNGRPPLLQIRDVPVGRHRISTLTMGEGPDVLLRTGSAGPARRCSRPRPRSAAAIASTPPTCLASDPRASRPPAATTRAGSRS